MRVLKRSNTTYRQRVIFSVPRKGPPCIKNSTGSTETADFFGLKPETLCITSASNNVLLWSTFEVLLRTQTKMPGYSFWGLKSGTPDPPRNSDHTWFSEKNANRVGKNIVTKCQYCW